MSYKCVVGDVVSFKHDKYVGIGVVKFVGSLLPNKRGLWVGIEREITKSRESKDVIDDTERPEGYNGKLNDMKYFTVRKNRGIFVPYECVEPLTRQTDPPSPLIPVRKAPSNEQCDSDIHRQLQKTQQLLEASLLLIQNCSLDADSVDKTQLASHCKESWKFLNKEQNIHIEGDDDEEKFGGHAQPLTMDTKKQIVHDFMTRYSKISNWRTTGKDTYGDEVEAYRLQFNNRSIEVRMSFLYSMMLYLIHCTGSNKRCIAHGTILLMTQTKQLNTLANEFEMVLQTLQHIDDDGLWQYVYTFIQNVFTEFPNIQPYSGKRIVLDDTNFT
eukprot:1041125_1